MKLHTTFITYNRLELTKQAIFSYRETVSVPYTFTVVDNNSSDDTKKWLLNSGFDCHLLHENRYPGFACNLGWSHAPADATYLHRADNDFIFLPGWDQEVERMFSEDGQLGQLGLRTNEEELSNGHNVGGNCVIPKWLWDEGLRWDERPWPEIKTVGYTEDSFMSPEINRRGYVWTRVEHPCIQPIGFESPEDPYYRETWAARGIVR